MSLSQCRTLLHELAGNVQKTSKASSRAATRSSTAAHLTLHVELEGHLSSLGDSILLSSAGIL